MDLENQKRVKEFAEEYGPENVVVIVGAAEGYSRRPDIRRSVDRGPAWTHDISRM